MPRGIQDSSRREFINKGKNFIKHGNVQVHQGKKDVIESASKWLKVRKTREVKDPQNVHSI